MRRLALVVALALVLSGCNAIGGATTDRPTLTPAPVPETTPTATESRSCLGPALAVSGQGAPTQSTPATPLPFENGSVDGAALVRQHVSVLANHSYHLRTDRHELWVLSGGRAFTYRSVSYEWAQIHAYAVDERLYMFVRANDTTQAVELAYEPEPLSHHTSLPTLTNRRWLLFNVAPFDYELVDARPRNGTRVLRTTFVDDFQDGPTNVTISVDRRGIIRSAVLDPVDASAAARETYTVTDVDAARPYRPAVFCRADWSDVTVQGFGPGGQRSVAPAN